jgi:predicted GNAT superfamily acetyltransferase
MSTAANHSPTIREVKTAEELRAVERLQVEVWGIPDLDVVPLYHLVAAQASGGVLLGAFDGDEMVGFVYGFVGLERGRMVHHSHMLAVREEYRSQRLGFRLKSEQRKFVMDQGIDTMTWTFDPLRSLNASFNFGKLGIIADRYYPDFYGSEAASFLHRNGTDRLWVTWHLSDPRVIERLEGRSITDDISSLPVLVAVCETGAPIVRDLKAALRSTQFIIEIPGDIGMIEAENLEAARNWRTTTRTAFTAALDAGYVVVDFVKSKGSGRVGGSYILSKDESLKIW